MESFALRDLAHELRQPLSTIDAIAYYLALVLPQDDDKTHEQLSRLQHLVEQSNWILSNSLQLAEPLGAERQRIDLEEVIAGVAANHPLLLLDLEGECLVQADPGLARLLVENILTLFRQIVSEANPATVRAFSRLGGVTFEVETSAPGFRSIAGGSLSLQCARRIVEAHAGSLNVCVEPTGVRLQVVLP